MKTTFEFNQEFGTAKELFCKNFNKLHLSVHPDFSGIQLCYIWAFQSIKADLSIFVSNPELHVWKDPNIVGYIVANNFHLYLHFLNTTPQNIKLQVHSFPQDVEKINLIKQQASLEFLKFLSTFHHDLNKLNPERLQELINMHISSKVILNLNKENSFKPHCTISLDLLAKLMKFTRNQLNQRMKNIKQERTQIFNKLSLHSSCVKELIDRPDSCLSTEKIWRS